MKYRIDAAVKSASDGYRFNITNERGTPIVTFAYVDEPEAEMARALIQNAIINAVSIPGTLSPDSVSSPTRVAHDAPRSFVGVWMVVVTLTRRHFS